MSIAARSTRLRRAIPHCCEASATSPTAAQVAALFDEALRALGGLDVLVNNAGIAGPTAKCEDVAPEAWERTLAVNITGQFHCARLAIPHLRRSANASIVNLSSAAGRFGFRCARPTPRRSGR